jgi:hypothetical protein
LDREEEVPEVPSPTPPKQLTAPKEQPTHLDIPQIYTPKVPPVTPQAQPAHLDIPQIYTPKKPSATPQAQPTLLSIPGRKPKPASVIMKEPPPSASKMYDERNLYTGLDRGLSIILFLLGIAIIIILLQFIE